MPTLKPENLSPEQTIRKDAYEQSRGAQRRRKRLYHDQVAQEVESREEAAYLVDSSVGRLTAMNVSQLPRRRLGSLHQGLHYTGNDPTHVDFHLCSRDIETRENAEDLIVLDLETNGRLWGVAQATLDLPDTQFVFLLTQERMFQDLWGDIPNRRRYNLKYDRKRRDNKTNASLPMGEEARLPTKKDLSLPARKLLNALGGWIKADTQKAKTEWVAFVQSLGFDHYRLCRRIQRLLLMTGRAESYFFFKYMLDINQITLRDIIYAVKADHSHIYFLASSTFKGQGAKLKQSTRNAANMSLSKKIQAKRAEAKYAEDCRAKLVKKRGLERDEGKINYYTRKRDGALRELETLKKKREKEKAASLVARSGKHRGKRDDLRKLADDDQFEAMIDQNFEDVAKQKRSAKRRSAKIRAVQRQTKAKKLSRK